MWSGEYTKYLLRLDVLMFQLTEHDTVIKTDKNSCIICQTSGEKKDWLKESKKKYRTINTSTWNLKYRWCIETKRLKAQLISYIVLLLDVKAAQI